MNHIKIENKVLLLDDDNFVKEEIINNINFSIENGHTKGYIKLVVYYDHLDNPSITPIKSIVEGGHAKDECIFLVQGPKDEIYFSWSQVNGKHVYMPESITKESNLGLYSKLKKLYDDKNFLYSGSALISVKFKKDSLQLGTLSVRVHSTLVEDAREIKEAREKAQELIKEDIIEFFARDQKKLKSKTIVK